jgi:hypothetical protein
LGKAPPLNNNKSNDSNNSNNSNDSNDSYNDSNDSYNDCLIIAKLTLHGESNDSNWLTMAKSTLHGKQLGKLMQPQTL